ncbi:MAG: RNase adapter RapZ, partial [Myxococcaceae bacterium]
SDSTLIRRFQETRRPHPLDKTGQGLAASIGQERLLLADLGTIADRVIQTDNYNSHELKAEIARLVGAQIQDFMTVRLMSFGFKYGLPQELDLCLDARFLKNPYFIPELKSQSGLDMPVREFVLGEPNTQLFIEKSLDLFKFLIPCYQAEKKTYLTIAIGCTGGRHRSPALVCEIARLLELSGNKIQITHRDIQK